MLHVRTVLVRIVVPQGLVWCWTIITLGRCACASRLTLQSWECYYYLRQQDGFDIKMDQLSHKSTSKESLDENKTTMKETFKFIPAERRVRSHRKSRNGCSRCKSKRMKVSNLLSFIGRPMLNTSSAQKPTLNATPASKTTPNVFIPTTPTPREST